MHRLFVYLCEQERLHLSNKRLKWYVSTTVKHPFKTAVQLRKHPFKTSVQLWKHPFKTSAQLWKHHFKTILNNTQKQS